MKKANYMTKKELPECPVATTVQIIGSKWKLLILTNSDKKSPTSKTRKWRDELSLLPCYNTSVVI